MSIAYLHEFAKIMENQDVLYIIASFSFYYQELSLISPFSCLLKAFTLQMVEFSYLLSCNKHLKCVLWASCAIAKRKKEV